MAAPAAHSPSYVGGHILASALTSCIHSVNIYIGNNMQEEKNRST